MEKQPSKPGPRDVVRALTFEFPQSSQKVVVNNYDAIFGVGTIRVRATRATDTTVRMAVIVRDETDPIYDEPMPPSLPAAGTQAGLTELFPVAPGSGTFQNDTVPVLNLPGASPVAVANNKRVFFGSYDVNNNLLVADSVAFMAFPGTFPVVVDARCCIWLTFAEDAAELPNGEKPPEYRPIPLLVPDKNGLNATITKVNLAARATDRWQKGPAAALITDADGLVGSEANLADPNYKTVAAAHAANITGMAFRKGRLVALWDDGSQTATEVDVGLSNPMQNLPGGTRPAKLHLAFHDGVEWSNNTGSVVVQVSWQA